LLSVGPAALGISLVNDCLRFSKQRLNAKLETHRTFKIEVTHFNVVLRFLQRSMSPKQKVTAGKPYRAHGEIGFQSGQPFLVDLFR
jgi:hypothetical protein